MQGRSCGCVEACLWEEEENKIWRAGALVRIFVVRLHYVVLSMFRRCFGFPAWCMPMVCGWR